jgi:hypothetical protein
VKYLWNGSTPRRDRWTRSVVTVEHAAITVRVARRILTHGKILANKTNNLDNLDQGASLEREVRGLACRRL